jgi:hypothetical protein
MTAAPIDRKAFLKQVAAQGLTPAPASRLLKATCPDCGYTIRITKKWVDAAKPVCPTHGALAVEGLDKMPAPPAPVLRDISPDNADWWARRWIKTASPAELEAMRAALAAI